MTATPRRQSSVSWGVILITLVTHVFPLPVQHLWAQTSIDQNRPVQEGPPDKGQLTLETTISRVSFKIKQSKIRSTSGPVAISETGIKQLLVYAKVTLERLLDNRYLHTAYGQQHFGAEFVGTDLPTGSKTKALVDQLGNYAFPKAQFPDFHEKFLNLQTQPHENSDYFFDAASGPVTQDFLTYLMIQSLHAWGYDQQIAIDQINRDSEGANRKKLEQAQMLRGDVNHLLQSPVDLAEVGFKEQLRNHPDVELGWLRAVAEAIRHFRDPRQQALQLLFYEMNAAWAFVFYAREKIKERPRLAQAYRLALAGELAPAKSLIVEELISTRYDAIAAELLRQSRAKAESTGEPFKGLKGIYALLDYQHRWVWREGMRHINTAIIWLARRQNAGFWEEAAHVWGNADLGNYQLDAQVVREPENGRELIEHYLDIVPLFGASSGLMEYVERFYGIPADLQRANNQNWLTYHKNLEEQNRRRTQRIEVLIWTGAVSQLMLSVALRATWLPMCGLLANLFFKVQPVTRNYFDVLGNIPSLREAYIYGANDEWVTLPVETMPQYETAKLNANKNVQALAGVMAGEVALFMLLWRQSTKVWKPENNSLVFNLQRQAAATAETLAFQGRVNPITLAVQLFRRSPVLGARLQRDVGDILELQRAAQTWSHDPNLKNQVVKVLEDIVKVNPSCRVLTQRLRLAFEKQDLPAVHNLLNRLNDREPVLLVTLRHTLGITENSILKLDARLAELRARGGECAAIADRLQVDTLYRTSAYRLRAHYQPLIRKEDPKLWEGMEAFLQKTEAYYRDLQRRGGVTPDPKVLEGFKQERDALFAQIEAKLPANYVDEIRPIFHYRDVYSATGKNEDFYLQRELVALQQQAPDLYDPLRRSIIDWRVLEKLLEKVPQPLRTPAGSYIEVSNQARLLNAQFSRMAKVIRRELDARQRPGTEQGAILAEMLAASQEWQRRALMARWWSGMVQPAYPLLQRMRGQMPDDETVMQFCQNLLYDEAAACFSAHGKRRIPVQWMTDFFRRTFGSISSGGQSFNDILIYRMAMNQLWRGDESLLPMAIAGAGPLAKTATVVKGAGRQVMQLLTLPARVAVSAWHRRGVPVRPYRARGISDEQFQPLYNNLRPAVQTGVGNSASTAAATAQQLPNLTAALTEATQAEGGRIAMASLRRLLQEVGGVITGGVPAVGRKLRQNYFNMVFINQTGEWLYWVPANNSWLGPLAKEESAAQWATDIVTATISMPLSTVLQRGAFSLRTAMATTASVQVLLAGSATGLVNAFKNDDFWRDGFLAAAAKSDFKMVHGPLVAQGVMGNFGGWVSDFWDINFGSRTVLRMATDYLNFGLVGPWSARILMNQGADAYGQWVTGDPQMQLYMSGAPANLPQIPGATQWAEFEFDPAQPIDLSTAYRQLDQTRQDRLRSLGFTGLPETLDVPKHLEPHPAPSLLTEDWRQRLTPAAAVQIGSRSVASYRIEMSTAMAERLLQNSLGSHLNGDDVETLWNEFLVHSRQVETQSGGELQPLGWVGGVVAIYAKGESNQIGEPRLAAVALMDRDPFLPDGAPDRSAQATLLAGANLIPEGGWRRMDVWKPRSAVQPKVELESRYFLTQSSVVTGVVSAPTPTLGELVNNFLVKAESVPHGVNRIILSYHPRMTHDPEPGVLMQLEKVEFLDAQQQSLGEVYRDTPIDQRVHPLSKR